MKKIKVFNILTGASFIDPVLVMFFLAKGLTFTELMTLTSIAYMIVLISEIPSGLLADQFGDKRILLAGSVLNIVSATIFIFGNTFLAFIFGSAFSAFSSALISGCDGSFTFKIVSSHDIDFGKYVSVIQSYAFYFMGISALIGGYIYSYNMIAPLILNILMYIVLFITIYSIDDSKILSIQEKNSVKQKINSTELKRIIGKNKTYLGLLCIAVIIGMFTYIGKSLTQPLLDYNGIDIRFFGLFYFATSVVAGVGASMYKKISSNKIITNYRIILVILLITFLSVIVLEGYFIVISVVLLSVARGLSGPFMSTVFNLNISDKYRATLLSVKNLLISLAITLVSPIIGFGVDSIGLKNIFLVTAVLVSIVLLLSIGLHYFLKTDKYEFSSVSNQ